MRSSVEARRLHEDGRPARALPHAQAALAIVERERGPDHADTANVCLGLSLIHEQLSEYDQAEAYARRAVEITRAVPGGATATRLRIHALAQLATIERIRGRIGTAERLYREVLDLADGESAHPDLVTLLSGLGIVYKAAGRYDDAEALYRRALAITGPDGRAAASLWHNLAGLDHARGRYAAGEPAARRSVALRSAALGAQHPTVAADQAALASLLAGQGKYDEAETLYRHALDVFERVYNPDNYEIAVTCNDLGVLMAARGNTQHANQFYRRALHIKQTIFGPDHAEVALTRRNLAAASAARHARTRRSTSTTSSTNSNDDRTIPHQKVLSVVSVETNEVEVIIGPRRISGLVMVTAKLENEARSARVHHDAAKRP